MKEIKIDGHKTVKCDCCGADVLYLHRYFIPGTENKQYEDLCSPCYETKKESLK